MTRVVVLALLSMLCCSGYSYQALQTSNIDTRIKKNISALQHMRNRFTRARQFEHTIDPTCSLSGGKLYAASSYGSGLEIPSSLEMEVPSTGLSGAKIMSKAVSALKRITKVLLIVALPVAIMALFGVRPSLAVSKHSIFEKTKSGSIIQQLFLKGGSIAKGSIEAVISHSENWMGWDELVSWLGNGIFFIGQLMQAIHVQETKSSKDISYLSLFLALTANVLFTAYGVGSNSPSMFFGMGAATLMSLFQVYQKHKFDKKHKHRKLVYLEKVLTLN